MNNIILLPDRNPQLGEPSDLLEKTFADLMSDDVLCQITILVRVDKVAFYDCGYPTHEIAVNMVELGLRSDG